jgi:hypothetical protein
MTMPATIAARFDPATPVRVRMVSDIASLEAFAPEWNDLCTHDATAGVFGSPAWIINWWKGFSHGDSPSALTMNDGTDHVSVSGFDWKMHVFVVVEHPSGRAVAVLPMVSVLGRFGNSRGRFLSTAVNGHSPRSAICAVRFDDAVVAALCDAIAADASWDTLILDGLSMAGDRVQRLVAALGERGLAPKVQSQWAHSFLGHPGISYDQLLESHNRNFRKHIWQDERALAKLGTIEVQRHAGEDAFRTGYPLFVAIDGQSWKASRGEALANVPALERYYGELVQRLARDGHAEVWILKVGGEPAAGYICLRDAGAIYSLKTSYSERFSGSSRISPSHVLLAKIIEHAIETDGCDVDFVGKKQFVERWADRDLCFTHLVFERPAFTRFIGRVRRALSPRPSAVVADPIS